MSVTYGLCDLLIPFIYLQQMHYPVQAHWTLNESFFWMKLSVGSDGIGHNFYFIQKKKIVLF